MTDRPEGLSASPRPWRIVPHPNTARPTSIEIAGPDRTVAWLTATTAPHKPDYDAILRDAELIVAAVNAFDPALDAARDSRPVGEGLREEPGPGLDAAWAEAEAALPEGWEMTVSSSKYRGGWVAYANEYQLGRAPGSPYIPTIESEPFPGSHPTPVAALCSLTLLLESDPRLRALREADPS